MTQILTMQDYRSMPWKNGQGSTLEVARSHGEGLEDFDWRVSIADVKTAGPFSHFINRQRIIGVLEGDGLILHVDDKAPITLSPKAFFAFHGESCVHAELINGAIRDFNIIYNPEKYRARLQWVSLSSINTWISDASEILVFNVASNLGIKIDSETFNLNSFETLLIKNNQQPLQWFISPQSEASFCIIELFLK
ncbi:TPA: HutD family protein [Providencia rettgeri]